MARLLVFNPDHDYALAHGGPNYMAPASVKRLESSLALLPAIYGNDGDFILKPDNQVVSIASPSESIEVENISGEISEIIPWGWNASLLRRLRLMGLDSRLLPSEEYIENLRRLSHRRISIAFNRFLNSPYIPDEIFSVEEGMKFMETYGSAFFKLPWSSGGRGVVTTRELSPSQVEEWLRGALRRQHSVLAEPAIDRVLDFASLWDVSPSEVRFCGWSVSLSDGRGKYDGNLYGSQAELLAYIKRRIPGLNATELLLRQQEFIRAEIAGKFIGVMGVDMMADSQGTLYPCVEVNLRRTMGHVALSLPKALNSRKYLLTETPLPFFQVSK